MSEATSSADRAHEVGVVLVHGAGHGAWCWEEVVGPLEAAGLRVHAVDLPMTTLAEDAEVVRSAVRAMRQAARAVLVVAHSYGGVVISAGGHDADALMFCSGVMPDSGQTGNDVAPLLTTAEIAAAVVVDPEGRTFSLNPELAVTAFYGRCSPAQAAAAVARLRSTHLACFNEPVTAAAWRTVPASYVMCEEDRAVAPDYQRGRAEVLGDAITLSCDHSPFYSATEPLVARIVDVASRLRGAAGAARAD